MTDYESRAKEFGFASPEEIKEALANPSTYVLDVRTPEEIADSDRVQHANWRQTNCTASACPMLESNPEDFVSDKHATVVIYCRSGRRAARAKQILEEKGYQGPILNAGGYDDLDGLH